MGGLAWIMDHEEEEEEEEEEEGEGEREGKGVGVGGACEDPALHGHKHAASSAELGAGGRAAIRRARTTPRTPNHMGTNTWCRAQSRGRGGGIAAIRCAPTPPTTHRVQRVG